MKKENKKMRTITGRYTVTYKGVTADSLCYAEYMYFKSKARLEKIIEKRKNPEKPVIRGMYRGIYL